MGGQARVQPVAYLQIDSCFCALVINFLNTRMFKSLIFTETNGHSVAAPGQTGESVTQRAFVWAQVCAPTCRWEPGGQRPHMYFV